MAECIHQQRTFVGCASAALTRAAAATDVNGMDREELVEREGIEPSTPAL
jgi:hypothetical protein